MIVDEREPNTVDEIISLVRRYGHENFKNFVYGMIPMKKLVDVQDIVDGILYLCSPKAKMITGTSLLIDGGWTAH